MSKTLQPVQIDENTVIYIEATEDVAVPTEVVTDRGEAEEVQRGGQKGMGDLSRQAGNQAAMQAAKSFEQIQTTIQTYTKYTLNAFRDAALADVKKVTLEFGVNVSGVGGVPYIATGTVGCNIKVTVECAFPEKQAALPPPIAPHHAVPQHSTQSARPEGLPRQPQPARMP